MSDKQDEIFDDFAKLRELFPDDLDRIKQDEEAAEALLQDEEYSQHPGTQKIIRLCREAIVTARVKLANDRGLDEEARRLLWSLIEGRAWFLKLVARDFKSELEKIRNDVHKELER